MSQKIALVKKRPAVGKLSLGGDRGIEREKPRENGSSRADLGRWGTIFSSIPETVYSLPDVEESPQTGSGKNCAEREGERKKGVVPQESVLSEGKE